MASVSFEITVQGAGHVELPVEVGGGTTDVTIEGLGTADVPFSVTNPLDREVVIPALEVRVEGPSKDKITATLLQDSLTIPPGGQAANTLTVEANEALNESDVATVRILGSEAA